MFSHERKYQLAIAGVIVMALAGIAILVGGIIIQVRVCQHVGRLHSRKEVFAAKNPEPAVNVESTVYLSCAELRRFAQSASRTFIVARKDNNYQLSEIWAFVERHDATTPYGAMISEAPKGKPGWYDYRIRSYAINDDSVEIIWEPFTRWHNLVIGIGFGVLAWFIVLFLSIGARAERDAIKELERHDKGGERCAGF